MPIWSRSASFTKDSRHPAPSSLPSVIVVVDVDVVALRETIVGQTLWPIRFMLKDQDGTAIDTTMNGLARS